MREENFAMGHQGTQVRRQLIDVRNHGVQIGKHLLIRKKENHLNYRRTEVDPQQGVKGVEPCDTP